MRKWRMVPTLFLWNLGGIRPLPLWARWFVKLGAEVRAAQDPKERLTGAVSVPHRGYAALLVALGVVHESFRAEAEESDDPAVRLASLEVGMPITLIDLHHKIRFARVLETRRDDSGRLLSIKYDRNGHGVASDPISRVIDKCTSIDFAGTEDLEFQHGRPVCRDPEFTAEFVGPERFERFVCHNRKSCLIVGEVKSLIEELEEIRFAVNEDAPNSGSLFDILRPRLGNQDQPLHRSVPARSHIIRSSGVGVEDLIEPESFVPGACTVFDGGLGYQSHRDRAVGNSVVLVNRWASHAVDSVGAFRNDLASSSRDADLKVMHSVPRGIEIAGFWSRR